MTRASVVRWRASAADASEVFWRFQIDFGSPSVVDNRHSSLVEIDRRWVAGGGVDLDDSESRFDIEDDGGPGWN